MGVGSSQEHGMFHNAPCNCDLTLVVVASKQMELLLEQRFGATGAGLHEKITTANNLPSELQRTLRKIATIRNKLVHEAGFDSIPDRTNFLAQAESAKVELLMLSQQRAYKDDKEVDAGRGCVIY